MLSTGTPRSLRPSLSRLMPPKSTVPPSGTLTVVVTVWKANVGNWTVVPLLVVVCSSAALCSPMALASAELRVVLCEPSKVNVLTSPMEVTQQLTGPHSQPVVHIPLPGWVWNLERRKQWQDALNQWGKIDNVVIFVELPPASVPESVLLGENVPQLVWLARSGKADAADTRAQLETLRHARANLVGAVLNRAPNHAVKKRFARWV